MSHRNIDDNPFIDDLWEAGLVDIPDDIDDPMDDDTDVGHPDSS